jgi:hypothetical protein
MRAVLAAAIAAGLLASPAGAQSANPSRPPVWNAAGAAQMHASGLIEHAGRLLKSGDHEGAVFWFYLGQLRYRAYLAAHPGLLKDRDAALFASLMEVVGRPINEHAFGDIPGLARTIDRVLAWDAANPDELTPKATFAAERAAVRDGLVQMRNQVVAQADEIRATRARNGLRNRP